MAAENKPEGLKKIRNPDRMYRSAVCYAGHAPPKSISDDTEMNNEHGHLKIYLPKKLLECLPKCSSLPKERHRWNTNERHPSMQADIHPSYWFSSFLFILNLTSEP
ncbi:calmodulin-binding transcription activator 1-like [Salmo trutta]|uniref:calmodulin-binding transcription activator 1-like n=1 Tax=Salmo trutta TaxID=8032 RepID=UPI00113145D3|nr:calmodulin-binding transcription activator 1-like [Salmo trutta]